MVRSEENMSLKNPVTPSGIDLGTIRLVAQRLNHYATPVPSTISSSSSNTNCFMFIRVLIYSSMRRPVHFFIVPLNKGKFRVYDICQCVRLPSQLLTCYELQCCFGNCQLHEIQPVTVAVTNACCYFKPCDKLCSIMDHIFQSWLKLPNGPSVCTPVTFIKIVFVLRTARKVLEPILYPTGT